MKVRRIAVGLAATLALGLLSSAAAAAAATPTRPTVAAARSVSLATATATTWNWNRNIVFGDGWAIGGWEELILNQDGSYRFHGHVHDSGGVSYDFGTVMTAQQPDGQVLTFATTGHVRGTCYWFSCDGSRDYDWDYSGSRAEVAGAFQTGFQSHARSATSVDLGSIFDALTRAFGTAARVVAIVGPLL